MDVLSDIYLSDQPTHASLGAIHDANTSSNASVLHRLRAVNISIDNATDKPTKDNPEQTNRLTPTTSAPSPTQTSHITPSSQHHQKHPNDSSNANLSLPMCNQNSQSFPQPSHSDEDILEVTDYYEIRSPPTSTLHHIQHDSVASDYTSQSPDNTDASNSLSSDSTGLDQVERDHTFEPIPSLLHRTYRSSSDSENSSYQNNQDDDDLYESLSSDSTNLDFVRSDATYFWVLHGIRKTYSTQSDQSFAQGDIETLPSDTLSQDSHVSQPSHSPTSDFSDLVCVRRDETFAPIPHVIRRTYSSSTSSYTSDHSFADGEIETLATSDGVNDADSIHGSMDGLYEINLGTSSEQLDADENGTTMMQHGHDDLESWSSSDFLVTRGCEGWPHIPAVVGRTYSSSEESRDMNDMRLTDSDSAASEFERQNSLDQQNNLPQRKGPREQIFISQFNHTKSQALESNKQELAPAKEEGTANKTENDLQKPLSTVTEIEAERHTPHNEDLDLKIGKHGIAEIREGVAQSASIDASHERCSTCGKRVEYTVPPSKRPHVMKKAGRLFRKCFGRGGDSSQACNCHDIKERRASPFSIVRACFKRHAAKSSR